MKGLRVPGTTLGRSIIIDMERKLPGDKVEDFDHLDDADLAEIRRQLARFAIDNMDALTGKTPTDAGRLHQSPQSQLEADACHR